MEQLTEANTQLELQVKLLNHQLKISDTSASKKSTPKSKPKSDVLKVLKKRITFQPSDDGVSIFWKQLMCLEFFF